MHFKLPGFEGVITSTRELDFGEIFRVFHSNRVSLVFLGLYIHVFRGFAYQRFLLFPV